MLNHPLPTLDEPVSALGDLPVGGAFRYWRGKSGRRYLHTVYSLAEWPGYASANVMFVRRMADDRQVLWVGQTFAADGNETLALLKRMRRMGANEVHIHLLAGSNRARDAVEKDLRAARPVMRLVSSRP